MFGLAQGRNSQHYILSSFVALDLIAGMGWVYFVTLIQKRWAVLNRASITIITFFALIAIQFGSALPYYPYYFSYQNQSTALRSFYGGYGEGLELAAVYLSQKPDAQNTRVFAYAGMGPFSFFYAGHVSVLKKVYLLEKGYPSIIEEMRNSDYIVLYSVLQNRQPESVDFLKIMKSVQPEKIIYIKGVEYVSIYKATDIPESVYQALSR